MYLYKVKVQYNRRRGKKNRRETPWKGEDQFYRQRRLAMHTLLLPISLSLDAISAPQLTPSHLDRVLSKAVIPTL